MCYELANLEWSAIKPFLPNKPRGVPRVNGQRECDWVISYLCRQWLPFGKVEKVGFQFLPLRHLPQPTRSLHPVELRFSRSFRGLCGLGC
jgi:hypothetical protein